MTALSVTASQVLPGANAQVAVGLSAEAITAGQAVYVNASGAIALADANLAAFIAAPDSQKGIAVNSTPGAGQPVSFVYSGDITMGAGAAPAVGTIYVVGATAGAINPAADLAQGWQVVVLGVGKATNAIKVSVINSGQLVP